MSIFQKSCFKIKLEYFIFDYNNNNIAYIYNRIFIEILLNFIKKIQRYCFISHIINIFT